MKKKILLAVLISCSSIVRAQTFFSEDFASGIPGGWTNVDNSGNNVLWRTTTTGSVNTNVSVDTVLNPAGTTAANGYLTIDSDSAGQAVTQDAVLTTAAISCAGHSSVHLAFNEYFAQYLASTGTVSVSNDNVTWTDVHIAHAGLGLNQGTPNPNHVVADITAIAANQPAVYVRFSYHGEWDYWWFVDDVQLAEPPAVDLSASAIAKLNSEYTLIPYLQATALDLSAEVSNVGGTATAGGTALFEIFNGANQVFSENINLPSLPAGTSQVIAPTGTFAPVSAGSYKSKITVTIAGDANASNDAIESDPILLSDTVYARDDDNFAGTQGVGVGPGEDAITGQNFKVNVTDDLTSITFFMGDGFGAQAAGTPVYFTVHPQVNDTTNPDGSVLIATSETLLITPGMIPSGGAYYTLPLQSGPVSLVPGLYYIGIHETDSILTIGYSNSIYSPGAVWVHWNSIPSPPAVNGWAQAEDFTVEVAYMIRANFAGNWDAVAEISNAARLSIYPNPSAEKIYIRLDGFSETGDVTLTFANMLGQTQFTGQWNGKQVNALNVGQLNPGVYEVIVRSENISLSKKIVITR
jgi:hypothetical protein